MQVMLSFSSWCVYVWALVGVDVCVCVWKGRAAALYLEALPCLSYVGMKALLLAYVCLCISVGENVRVAYNE